MTASTTMMRTRWLCSAACAGLLATAGFAQEVPSGGQVVAGSASIGGSGANLAITQGSSRAVIDWKSFGVGAGGKVTIAQPDGNSALLNRVTGGDISKIAGSLTANGQVFLVNRNGIIVTPTGTIDARGGFVGSTLDITNDDFMAGRMRFAGAAGGLVLNQGRISGGAVALLGANVGNEGLIVSSLGKVALGSGDQATLDFSGDGYLQVLVPADLTDASGRPLVSNSGRIEAPGGIVMLSAATARAAVRQAVNMSGVIAAKSVSGQGGVVVLDGGSGGRVTVSGEIDASGADAGGRIDITGGDTVALTGATLTATGGTQGGLVRVGGMFQGGTPTSQTTAAQTDNFVTRFGAVPTLAAADTTNFDATSTIDVGGGASGGTAIVWSNLATTQAGQIRAGGGITGGSVELSSHGLLATSLPLVTTGLHGTLLLDPKNISVLDDNVVSQYNYTATTLPANGNVPYSAPGADPATTYFKVSDVIGLMNAGTDVILRASNDLGWGASNAAVDFNFASGGHSGNLTLSAGRSVTISGYLTLYSSSLTVIANDSAANGVIDADRDAGQANIETFNSIISAQTGSTQTPGNISFTLGTGAGLTNHAVATSATGNRLGPISGGNITLDSSGQNVTWAFFPATAQGQTAIDPVNVTATGAVTITGSISGNTSGGLTFSGSSVTWTDEATAKVTNGYSSFVAFVENGVTTRWGKAAPVGGGGGNFTRVSLGKGSAYGDIGYGDANPTPVQYHITSGALRGSDTLGTLASAFTGLTTSGLPAAYSAPGTYTITTTAAIDTADAPGGYFYNLTTATDTIHINPKALLPTVTNGSYTYGSPAALVTLSGVLNNDLVAPVATLDATAGTVLSTNGTGFGFATLLGAGNHSFTLTGLSGAAAGNYTLDTSGLISGTIAIARKALTYQIYDSTTNYGTLGSPASFLTGIVGSDSVALATLSSTGLSTSASVGSYTVSGSGLSGTAAANYTLAGTGNTDGTLTIQPKPITYIATGGTSVYGDTPTLAAPTLTGIINGDQVSGAVLANGIATTLTNTSTAATYGITAGITGTDAANYTIANAGNTSAVYTITRRPLTFSVASLSGVYGTPSPVLTVTGLTGLDTAQPFLQSDGSTVSLQYLGSDTYGYVASAGTHSFVFNGLTGGAASNYSYDLSSATRTGTYIVTPKPITFSVADRSRTFRTTDALPTVTLTGLVGADYGTVSGQLSLNGSAVTAYNDLYALNAGTYGLSVGVLNGSSASNYSIAPTGNHIGVYTVTPATIFYQVGNASSTYGTVASLPAASLFGTYFADDVQGIVGAGQNNTPVALGVHSSVGTYQLSVTGLSGANAGNYTISSVGNTLGTLTINPKALTYTVGGGSFVYGQTIAASGLNFNGVVSGDTVGGAIGISSGNVQGQSFDATIGRRGVGTWYLGLTSLTGAQASDYVIAATGNSYGQISVTPKALTYTIASGSVVYGDGTALPTAVLGGIESGDTVVPGATLIKSGTSLYPASAVLNVGSYATTLTGIGGGSAANYTLANSGTATGTVAITQRPVTAAVLLNGGNSSVSYGTYLATTTIGFANLNNLLPNDQTRVSAVVTSPLLPAAGSGSLKVGTYGFTATGLTGSLASNYMLVGSDTLQLTVTPRALSAAYGTFTSTYGTIAAIGLPSLSGIIAGDAVTSGGTAATASAGGTVTIGTQTPAGSYTITASGLSGADAGNYSIAQVSTTLTINPKPITYAIASASSTYGSTPVLGAATLTGLVGTDAVAGAHSLSITDRSNAGAYSDTLSGLTGSASANYVLATNGNTAGIYTINPKPLGYSLIAANTNQSITYLDTAKSFGALTGVLSGDSVAPLIIASNGSSSYLYDPANFTLTAGSWSFSLAAFSSADKSWNLGGASAANYVLPFSALPSGAIGAVSVAKKQVIYTTTAPATGVYGDTIGYSFTLSGVPTGYMNQVSIVPLLDGNAFDSSQAAFTAGTHQIGATLNSANFVMSGGTPSQITISQRPLTATLNSASTVYGSTISNLLVLSNIVRNDAIAPVIGMAGQSYTLGTQTIGYGLSNMILDAGTRSFTITGLSGSLAANYTIGSIVGAGQLIVTPKPLTWSVAPVQGQYGGISSLAPYNGCSYAIVCYLGTQANFGPGKVTLTGVINNDAVSGNVLVADGVTAQPYAVSLAPGTYAQVVGSLSGAKAGNYSLATAGNTAGAMTIVPGVVQVSVSGGGRIYDNGDRTTYQAIGTPGVINAVRSTNYPGTPVTGFVAGDDVGVLVTVYQNGQAYTGGTNFATGTYEFRPVGLIGTDAYKYSLLPIGAVGSSSGTFVVSDSSVFNFSFLSATPNVAYTPPASVTTFQANATGSGSGSATSTQTALSFAAQASGSGSGSASVSYGPLSITASASASAATLASFGVSGITLSASAGAHAAVTLAIGPASMIYGADGSASATASLGTGGLTLTTLASADAYQNLTVGGDLGSGVSGSSSSTARVFADAGSTNSATYSNGTVVVSEKQWAGVGASVGTSGTISGGGVSGSASITVYSPGSLGIGASSTSGYSDGTVTIGFSLGISIGIGGLEIAPSFSFDTKPIVSLATGIGSMISDLVTGNNSYCGSDCQAANAAAAKAADVQNKYNTALQMFEKAGDKPTADLMNYVAQNPEVAQKLDELKFNNDQDRFNLSRAVSTYGGVPAQLNSVVAQEQALVQKIQSNPGGITPGDLQQAQSLRDQEATLIGQMKTLGGTVQVANGKISMVASK